MIGAVEFVLIGLVIVAVASGGVALVGEGCLDWLDRALGPEERLGKCLIRMQAPREPVIKAISSSIPAWSTVVACASLFIWVAALPPFQMGIWYMGEPVEIALYASGALAAGVLTFSPTKDALDAIRHPLVLIPLALAGLTFALSAFVPFPARSWFGPPQSGEGGFWYLTLAMQVALFRLAALRWVVLAAVAGALVMGVLTVIGQHLNSFPDYFAFIGLALLIVDRHWTTMMASAALIVLSASKGAMLLCPILIGIGLFGAPWALALVAPFAAMIGIYALDGMPSAWARMMDWACAARALVSEPGVWWHGVGWGGFNDLMLRQRDLFLAMLRPGYGPNGADWHSHNEFIEAFVSTGFVGLALMLALFATAAWCAPDRLRVGCWAAYAGVSAIWMPIAIVVPFLALALAVSGGKPK